MLSKSHKKSISDSLKKAHKEGRHPGWKHINENNKRSYPEKCFSEILKDLNLYKKYLIIEQFSVNKYFLDFAIIDLKIDIEIDGQQHFRTKESILKDDLRDRFLKNNGWKVYRIAWLEILNKREKTINDFKIWLNNNSIYRKYNVNEILYLKKNKPKYGNRSDYFNEKKKIIENHYKQLILKTIKENNINFNKYGWVKEFSELSGIPSQKVSKWIKRCVPEFYKTCLKK